ncbi:MAG TPA: protein kinase [Polyangiaceae bacterium]|nr:protein kinase [Polyangiaceae bacterium]
MLDVANAERIADGDRSCLSPEEVLDVARGRAKGERLAGIDAHVARCDACQERLGDAQETASSGPHELAAGATFREGDVVAGRYRIHRFVARGGMGEVYDAFDRDLQERVALKTVLSTSNDAARAVRRLRIEVQLAHRVSHPNVCRIYDLGSHVLASTGARMNFLTMEFIEGESLRTRIERGRLSVVDSIAIARQLLLGLKAAHSAGILHRDFKSENVMLRSSVDGPPGASIMDFGLASPIDPNLAGLTSGANALVGTPCYMSPEQLEGAPLSAASDLYSFGVVWFEMLTGHLPFSIKAPFDRLRREAPRPSRRSEEIPSALDAIVARCLARVRERRFASADQVLAALDVMESSPAAAARGSRGRRAQGALALAALCASLLGWVALKPSATPATARVAREPGQNPTFAGRDVPSPEVSIVTATTAPHDTASARAATTAPSGVTTARRDRPVRRQLTSMTTSAAPEASLAKVTESSPPAPREDEPALATTPASTDALRSTAAAVPATAAAATSREPPQPATAVTPGPAPSLREQNGFLNPFRRAPR